MLSLWIEGVPVRARHHHADHQAGTAHGDQFHHFGQLEPAADREGRVIVDVDVGVFCVYVYGIELGDVRLYVMYVRYGGMAAAI